MEILFEGPPQGKWSGSALFVGNKREKQTHLSQQKAYQEEEQKLNYFQAPAGFSSLDPRSSFGRWFLPFGVRIHHSTCIQLAPGETHWVRISGGEAHTSEFFKAAEVICTHCRLETTVPASPRDLVEIWRRTHRVCDYYLQSSQSFRRHACVAGMSTGLKSLWSSCSISPAEQPLINPLVPSFLLLYLRQGFKGLLHAEDSYPTTWAPRWPHCPGLMTKTKKSVAWFLSLQH